MLAMVAVGFDFVGAAGNSRCLNAATNLGSLLFFLGAGQVRRALRPADGRRHTVVIRCVDGDRPRLVVCTSIFILVVGALILRLAWGYWGN